MSYFRPMGDPITDPSQVDDSIIVGQVPPTRVECSSLPPDSPWRRPGQVCAPPPSIVDMIRGLIGGGSGGGSSAVPDATPPPTPTPVDGSPLPLLLGAAVAAYFLLRKKR